MSINAPSLDARGPADRRHNPVHDPEGERRFHRVRWERSGRGCHALIAVSVGTIVALAFVLVPAPRPAKLGEGITLYSAPQQVHSTTSSIARPRPPKKTSLSESGPSDQLESGNEQPTPGNAVPPEYGCAAALAYLANHANPEFTFACPGYADGNEAMTCVNVAGLCAGEHVIVINDPCPAAYMNEAYNSQSWSDVEGQFTRPIDPYGAC